MAGVVIAVANQAAAADWSIIVFLPAQISRHPITNTHSIKTMDPITVLCLANTAERTAFTCCTRGHVLHERTRAAREDTPKQIYKISI